MPVGAMSEAEQAPDVALVGQVAERLAAVRDRIAACGGPGVIRTDGVEILAVTKGFGVAHAQAAAACGLDLLGENYAQEMLSKVGPVGATADVSWHFLGRLQRNKVAALAPVVSVWQSVDRAPLVDAIARRAPGAAVMVQLNLSGEEQKGGVDPQEAPSLVAAARAAGLEVVGLMGVGPAGSPEAARPGFRRLVALAEELGLAQRSIGMSADLEVAVEEGSTMVRVGTALFGPRPTRPVGESG